MSDENILTLDESPETIAAEEAAFATSFSAERGDEPAEPSEPEATPLAEEVVEPDAPAAAEPAPVEPAPEPAATKPFTIAGLTEDQIAATLNRSSTLQSTVDKMAGRMGQLMQQIEQLRTNPPTTQSAQKAFDVKLDKLTAAFPELGALLAEDLKGMQGATAEPAPALPQGITQEQFDAALNARLSATTAQMRETIEEKVLGIIHPDWQQVIRTPQFALYRDNVLPAGEGEKLMSSEDANFISQHLSGFKAWLKPTPAPDTLPAQEVITTPAQVSRSRRLANAVLPAGNSGTVQAPVTEEDGFAAGFAAERKKSGY